MVKKYVKKPIPIEAIQWDGNNLDDIIKFVDKNITVESKGDCINNVVIHTLEGDMRANVGDYIIKGVSGEFYPCKPNIFEETYNEVIDKTYQYVDLGLPSGTLWARKNIGAESEYDTGLYFQWGDTVGYTINQVGKNKEFDWHNYKFRKKSKLTKYNKTDSKTVLDKKDDAAYVASNGKMRIPTSEQFQELVDYTNHEFVTDCNGKYMKFTSKTNESNFVIFPASGYAHLSSICDIGKFGDYWLSSLYTSDSDYGSVLYFDYNGYFDKNSGDYRCYGCPVRGVLIQ